MRESCILNMKCPACFHELTLVQVGSLEVDVCQGGCGGIWFDAFELQRVEDALQGMVEPLLHVQRDERLVVDRSRKRECPRCEAIKLHRHFFSARRQLEIDECPNCAGYWLDAGELAQLREEKAESAAAEQLKVSQLSPEAIRYLYRLQDERRRRV